MNSDSDSTLAADDSPIIKENPRNAALREEGQRFSGFLSRNASKKRQSASCTQVHTISSPKEASLPNKKEKLSQLQENSEMIVFMEALAKLPLICAKPSSLSHMSAADMRTLIMSKGADCSKLSKEDLRSKLFTLLNAGSFNANINSLHADLAVTHTRRILSGDPVDKSTAPSAFFFKGDESIWEVMDMPLLNMSSDADSGSKVWLPVEERMVDKLEGGNTLHFYSKLFKRYMHSREQSLNRVEKVSKITPSTLGTSGESLRLVREIREALRNRVEASFNSSSASVTCSHGSYNSESHPLCNFLQSSPVSCFRSVSFVRFTGPRLGLVLQRRGTNSVVVRNKTDAIDPEVMRSVNLGDEIVFVSPGGDLAGLDYENRLAAITNSIRPLWLGLVSH